MKDIETIVHDGKDGNLEVKIIICSCHNTRTEVKIILIPNKYFKHV